MRFLHSERYELDRLIPGLDAALLENPLLELEQPGNPALAAFRRCGGTGLLVAEEDGGAGADLLTAVRVQRAIGSRSPSLAVATTMHHFSVASLVEAASDSSGMDWMLLAAIAKNGLLVASGFAEGRTGQNILSPGMITRVDGAKILLSGSKKPCSLARSMDLLTSSVSLPADDGSAQLGVALIPADSAGISVRPFWNSPILAGAESDEVVLEDVEVSPELVVRTGVTADGQLDKLQTVGFVWFELLMAASYLGVVSALVERILGQEKVNARIQADAVSTVESAMRAVEAVARAAGHGPVEESHLADSLVCRYAAQDAIDHTAAMCVEALGGMAFIGSGEVAYLNSACRALAFHPPSRARMSTPLLEYYRGQPLRVP